MIKELLTYISHIYFISFVCLFLYFYQCFSERSVSILVTQLWFVAGLLNLPDMTKDLVSADELVMFLTWHSKFTKIYSKETLK